MLAENRLRDNLEKAMRTFSNVLHIIYLPSARQKDNG